MGADDNEIVMKIDYPGEFFTAVRLQSWKQVEGFFKIYTASFI